MFKFCAFNISAALGLALGAVPAIAADTPAAPTQCHDVDFLIGNWTAAMGGVVVAKVKWEAGPGNCYIKETWAGQNGSPSYAAIMAYSSEAHNWSYFGAAPGGTRERYDYGLLNGDELRFEQAEPGPTTHFSFFKRPDGSIRELSVSTTDGGHSWNTNYDVNWTRSGDAR